MTLLHLIATAVQIIFREQFILFDCASDPNKHIKIEYIQEGDKDSDKAFGEARVTYSVNGVIEKSFIWYGDSLDVNRPLAESDLIQWYKDIRELEHLVGDLLSEDWYVCDQVRTSLQMGVNLNLVLLHNQFDNMKYKE